MQTMLERRMMRHGLLVCLFGLLSGFVYLFSLLGAISLSPLPISIPMEFPGDPSRWRAIHTGCLMNGLMVLLFAAVLPKLELTEAKRKFVANGSLGAAWGNTAFYTFGALASNRGLSLGPNKFGEANLATQFAFWPAIVFAFILIAVVLVMLGGIPNNEGD